MNSYGSGEVEYTLDAVPEEATAVGAQKPASDTAAPPAQAATESNGTLADIGMDRLRLEDVDELEDWVKNSDSGESSVLHEYEEVMQAAETVTEADKHVVYPFSECKGSLQNSDEAAMQQQSSCAGIRGTHNAEDTAGSADVHDTQAQPQKVLVGYTENVSNGSEIAPAVDAHIGPEQQESLARGQYALAVEKALGSIMDTAGSSLPSSTAGSQRAGHSSTAQHADHAAVPAADSRHRAHMEATLELDSTMPMQSAGAGMSGLQGTADSFSFDDTSNNYGAAGSYYSPATAASTSYTHPAFMTSATGCATRGPPQGSGNGGAGVPARSTTLSLTVDRALGSIVSSVCDGPASQGHPDELSSKGSTASQQSAGAFGSAEITAGPGFPSHAPSASEPLRGHCEQSSSSQERLQEEGLLRGSSCGGGKPVQGPPDRAGSTLGNTQVHLDANNIKSDQEMMEPNDARPASKLQLQECLERTGEMGQQTWRSETQMVEDTQPSPLPRPRPCLPRMLSEIPSQCSSDVQTDLMQETPMIAPASTASPLPRPAPLFAAASLSHTGTLNSVYLAMAPNQDPTQTAQLGLGLRSGVQELEGVGPADPTEGEGAAVDTASPQSLQQEHCKGELAGSCTVRSGAHVGATSDCPTESALLTAAETCQRGESLGSEGRVSSGAPAQPQAAMSLDRFLSAPASLVDAVPPLSDGVTQQAGAEECTQVQQEVCTHDSIEQKHSSSDWVQPDQEQCEEALPEQDQNVTQHQHVEQDRHAEQDQPDQAQPGHEEPDQAQPERAQSTQRQELSEQRSWQQGQLPQDTPQLEQGASGDCTTAADGAANVQHDPEEAVLVPDSSVENPAQKTLEISEPELQSVHTPNVEAIETAAAPICKETSVDVAHQSLQEVVSPYEQSLKDANLPAQQADANCMPADESLLPADRPSTPHMGSTTSFPPPAAQVNTALQQPAAVADIKQPTHACQPKDACSHCGAKKDQTDTYPSDTVPAGEVLDRLALFACGRMGAEALLQGDVPSALQQLMDAGTQDGMALVASVIRRSVALTIGQRSAAQQHDLDTTNPILEILSQVIGTLPSMTVQAS